MSNTSLLIPPTIPEDETLLGNGTISSPLNLSGTRKEFDKEASHKAPGNELLTDDWMQESIKLISESHSDARTALEPLAELKRKQKIRKRKREQYWLPESKDSAQKFWECAVRLTVFLLVFALFGLAVWYWMEKHPHRPATRTTMQTHGNRDIYALQPSISKENRSTSIPSSNFSRGWPNRGIKTVPIPTPSTPERVETIIGDESTVTARNDGSLIFPEETKPTSVELPAKGVESLNRAQAQPGLYYRERYSKYFKEHVHDGVWKGAQYTVFEPSRENNIIPEFVVIRNVKIRDSLLQINKYTLESSSLPRWTWKRMNGKREPANKERKDWESCVNTEGDVLQFVIGRCTQAGWPHNAECPVYSFSMALHATFFTQRASARTWWVSFDTGSRWSKEMLKTVEMITGNNTNYATHVRFGIPEEACVDVVMYINDVNGWHGESMPWVLGREDIYRLRESLRQLPESHKSTFLKTVDDLSEVDVELRSVNRHGDREVANAKETLEFTKKYFERHGKTVHYLDANMDQLSVIDQWRSLEDADIIVTSHGAQEVNMIAASKCAAWLEIFPLGYFMPGYYGSMCEQYGMLYYYYYDRDARGGKPLCMIEDPALDPDTPGVKLIPDGGKEDFQLRKCRRHSKIHVDLDALEKLLGEMLFDHEQCLANGGPLRQQTDFVHLLADFKTLYTKDKQSPDVLHMSVKKYARPIDYLE